MIDFKADPAAMKAEAARRREEMNDDPATMKAVESIAAIFRGPRVLTGDQATAIMAGLTIAALPMFVLYVTGVRYFLSGFMAGSEK